MLGGYPIRPKQGICLALFLGIITLIAIPTANAKFETIPKCINSSYLNISLGISENSNRTLISQDVIYCPHGCISNLSQYGDGCGMPEEKIYCFDNDTLANRYFDGNEVKERYLYCEYGCIESKITNLGAAGCKENSALEYIIIFVVILIVIGVIGVLRR